MNKSAIKISILTVLLGGLFGLWSSGLLPLNVWIGDLLEWVHDQGRWGQAVFVLAYILATVAMVPGTILTLGAGLIYGLVHGVALVVAGSVLGAWAAFGVGRTVGRSAMEKRAADNPKFAAIDAAVADHGFKIVLLTRLSPIFPFNLLNYLFSVTKVRSRDYVLGSLIGMFPGTVMYVYFGTAVKSIGDLLDGNIEGGHQKHILLGIGLVATIAVTVYVTRVARRAIRQYVPEDSPEEVDSPQTTAAQE